MSMKELIINADDFGLSPGANRAIIRAWREGILTSASLMAGGEAFGVVISEWLFLTVFLLAMFLSTGKRLGEKIILGEEAGSHRKSLEGYPPGFLDGTMNLTGASVLVTYTMYALPHKPLVYSVPLCAYGLLRYILRVKSGAGGDPTESLVRDLQLLVVGLCWVVLVGWSIYW